MAEQMVVSYSRQFGISSAIVRLFSVYGCGLRKQLLWDACRKFAGDEYVFMGTGDEVRDWLHVDDAAELLLAAAEHASVECPTVNGGSGVGVTVRQVLLHLGSCLSDSSPAPVFSGTKRTGDPSRYVADIEASLSWGWLPKTNWELGVSEYARWWKERSK
jgi:UDP-glucose 4-epimerase